jgi:predicted nucleic acid-binding protein
MSTYLADTNILVRWVQPRTAEHEQAVSAVECLRRSGHTVLIAPQAVMEFWSVATRPAVANGLGLSVEQTQAEVLKVEGVFPLVPETPAVYDQWRRLVVQADVTGPQVHDARMVAIMLVHGISHLLTCDLGHFRRYPSITVVHPAQIVAPDPSIDMSD